MTLLTILRSDDAVAGTVAGLQFPGRHPGLRGPFGFPGGIHMRFPPFADQQAAVVEAVTLRTQTILGVGR